MNAYFAYIRVSTTKQGEQGSSLQEQRSAIEAYAARHDLRIVEWFEERETAAKQGRREFNRLTELLRKGNASGVIIHKIDRSARNLKDWAGLGELIDAGIDVQFAHEALDLQTRGGRLAADIQAVVAADFIRNLRQEVRKGIQGRLKQGFYPFKAPRGYLDCGKGRKEICPDTGPLVREAFELYATGTYSLELLRHELASRGLRGAGGRALGFEALSNLLHNPFYIGLMLYPSTGQLFEGNHTPLISKRTFDRVQGIMAGRLYPRVQKHIFLFRRLVMCAGCGRSLSGERQKGRIYYRCHDRACRNVCVTEERIDIEISAKLQLLILDTEDLGDLRDLLDEQMKIESQTADERRLAAERDLAGIDQRLARLTDALIDGLLDKPVFEERKTALLKERRDLRDRLESGEDVTFWKGVVERFEQGLTAYLGYQMGNDVEKREILQLVSSNLTVRQKQPMLSMYSPFQEIAEWSNLQYGAPDPLAVRTERAESLKRLVERIGRSAHADKEGQTPP